jgi:hypothetical protein
LNSHEPTGKGATRLRAALHPINGDQKIWPLEYFHKSVQDDALITSRSGLQIFFKYLLSVTNGLKRQLCIRHCLLSVAAKQPERISFRPVSFAINCD